MYNNVVSGVFNKFTQNGISCLRFNFRGVGRSSGNHTTGTGELIDTKTCIDFLLNEKNPANPDMIQLAIRKYCKLYGIISSRSLVRDFL